MRKKLRLWLDFLDFDDESIFALLTFRCRMRPVRKVGQVRIAKHIISKNRFMRRHTVAATDG